jgi:hypothetical protein
VQRAGAAFVYRSPSRWRRDRDAQQQPLFRSQSMTGRYVALNNRLATQEMLTANGGAAQ